MSGPRNQSVKKRNCAVGRASGASGLAVRIETEVLPTGKEAIVAAVRILAGGGLVAFPTDTVYGVGAHAFRDYGRRF